MIWLGIYIFYSIRKANEEKVWDLAEDGINAVHKRQVILEQRSNQVEKQSRRDVTTVSF